MRVHILSQHTHTHKHIYAHRHRRTRRHRFYCLCMERTKNPRTHVYIEMYVCTFVCMYAVYIYGYLYKSQFYVLYLFSALLWTAAQIRTYALTEIQK